MNRPLLGAVMVLVAATSACASVEGPVSAPPPTPGATHAQPASSSPAPTLPSGAVAVELKRISAGPNTISFGLPLAPAVAADTSTIRVYVGTTPIEASVTPLLYDHDADGNAKGLRAVRIQFPASVMTGPTLTVGVTFNAAGTGSSTAVVPFASLSIDSPEKAPVADRTIVQEGGIYRLQESNPRQVMLFTGREPAVIAHYPEGYLAHSGILGPQVTAAEVAADRNLAGLRFLSDAVAPFVRSASYEETYALNPAPDSVVDPVANYEGWLYDRCTTLLTAYSHVGDPTMLRHALRTCSYYSGKISLSGTTRGIFTGKPEADPKYSHLRGLYVYYALTGDEGAFASARAIADMWNADPLFVGPYRTGHLRGVDNLWTERLLGTSLEGLYYGFRLTGDKTYLTAFQEMLTTAYRHITTTNQSELVSLNLDPNNPPFPAQSCWIHNSNQAGEGYGTAQPWCSGWMSELVIDSLLAYQAQSGDTRVDEIFVQLARFLRDVGSASFDNCSRYDDRFLEPATCYDRSRGTDTRRLVPLYGSGLSAYGTRSNYGEWGDAEHCTDATALTAAALRALVRQDRFDQGGLFGPFASEGAAFLQMHHEFAACAQLTFQDWTRVNRDPSRFTSAALAAGAADPATYIQANKIGYPSRPSSPQRKLSWWFNTSMLQFGLLKDAAVAIPVLHPGAVQPKGRNCK